jgi:hypothetical protein
MMAGMLIRLDLPTGERDLTLVPKDALVLEGRKASVWVVRPHPEDPDVYTVQKLAVKSGASHGPFTEVDAPLADGDLLVIRGNERLKPSKDPSQPLQKVSILERRNIDYEFDLSPPKSP